VPTVNARHRRILTRLSCGDFLWEIPGQLYFAQYNDRTGRQIRVHLGTLEQMESLGLIERVRQVPSDHKLDFWQITDQGRQFLAAGQSNRDSSHVLPVRRTA